MKILKYYLQVIEIVFVTVFYSLKIVFLMAVLNDKKVFHRFSRIWSSTLLSICGVKLDIIGEEKLDVNDKYVYVSNHSSLFDIPVLLYGLKGPVRIMYKKELEKIPIFGWGLRKSPFIAIEREDTRNSMAGIETAIESIRNGDSIIVFPEGHRSPDGLPQAFKRGAFLLASRAGKSIVPITLIGTFGIYDKKNKIFHPNTIKFIINEPIPPLIESSSPAEKKLMNNVREIIVKSMVND